ncbi:anthranilate synthase family protein [Aeromonas dhakensis]|uniref:anthranilate synthase family protein n=1 Tax=Aeromonas dhakensis TaxID=196024 RepID=UPI0029D465FC|nr:anthranilate synthase family protein [Aeromonas dhakensis]MDX7698157.1 anthranilate synthase family protein [Aeromonas dhakensis]
MRSAQWLNQQIRGWLDDPQKAFALLYRPGRHDSPRMECLQGTLLPLQQLAELDTLCAPPHGRVNLLVAPYQQIAERGFQVRPDSSRMQLLQAEQVEQIALDDALAVLPDGEIDVQSLRFEPDDTAYRALVEKIVQREIGQGAGSNFVIKRTLCAQVPHYHGGVALTLFKNLLQQEHGAYWIFCIRLADVTLVGASPELHLSYEQGQVAMTPISGTYRFGPNGPDQETLLRFLADGKEEGELSMVLDEELKMMAELCPSNLRVQGPFLQPMSHLAHVGYRIEGPSRQPLSVLLKQSMFAPTVVGSPLENATRVIARYELQGRSYYSGFGALIETLDSGFRLDSSILIRTSEWTPDGQMRLGLGATLVRDSDPDIETLETQSKAAALLNALRPDPDSVLRNTDSPMFKSEQVDTALWQRRQRIAPFWRDNAAAPTSRSGPTVLILDNEDRFTSMMAYQLRSQGLEVQVRSALDREASLEQADVLLVGPGPGDPRQMDDPRVILGCRTIEAALARGQPLMAICFGHQLLCKVLGLPLMRLIPPNQGRQQTISIFGQMHTVGFYNTFAAWAETDKISTPYGEVEVYRNSETGEVFGLKGPGFCSMQFHPESVFSISGAALLYQAVRDVREICVLN